MATPPQLLRGFVMVLAFVSALPADEVRIEQVVPVDSGGRILQITPSLRRQLDLFPDIDGFAHARLFEGEDGAHVLDITFLDGKGEFRQLRPLSAAAVDSLRARLDAYLGRPQLGRSLDHSGRGELVFDGVVMSLAVYGPFAPVVLGVRGARPGLAAYMLTCSAGFYAPYRLTRHTPVTQAHRNLTRYGATRGLVAGFFLKHLIMGSDASDSDDAPRAAFRFATGTSVSAAWLGFRAVNWRGYTHGQAEAVGVMGDFGLASGAGLAWVLGLYDEDRALRAGDAMALAGAGAGLWLGEQMGRRQPYSQGDALVLRAGGVAGALAALPLVNVTGTQSSRAHVAGALAGQIAGITLTDRLLAPSDFTFGESLIVNGGEVAGALLGLGLTYLADTDGDFDDLAYFTSAAAGGLGGFVVTFRLFAR